MNIIWLSEIKWNYLKTRKQQIISRFPDDSSILFIEPISKKLSNNYYPIDYWLKMSPLPKIVNFPLIFFSKLLFNNKNIGIKAGYLFLTAKK